MKSDPTFDAIYARHVFSIIHSMHLHPVIPFLYSTIHCYRQSPPFPALDSYCLPIHADNVEVVWLHCKQIHQLLFCCFPDKAAAEGVLAVA